MSHEIKTWENISKEKYSLWKTPKELRKLFDFCESGSKVELLIVLNILNNPKTTPEDLDYYFFEVQEWSDAEYLIAKALIAHPNLTQELFDKNYGMAMQKWGLVFDLFEAADQERSKKAKEEKEKIENTMQGSIIRKDSERGTWIIHWDNGKDYLLHFSHIKDDNKADIFNELILGSKVEFKLVPYNWKPWIGLDPDFTATDIVVKS